MIILGLIVMVLLHFSYGICSEERVSSLKDLVGSYISKSRNNISSMPILTHDARKKIHEKLIENFDQTKLDETIKAEKNFTNNYDDWHNDGITSVAWSPDGQRIVSGSWDNTVKVWDLQKLACVATLIGHKGWVNTVDYGNKGKLIASGSWDKTIRLWNTSTFVHELKSHTGPVKSVVLTPDEKDCLSASEDKTIKVWDVESGKCTETLEGHTQAVNSVALSPSKKLCISGSDDRTVRVWDVRSGKQEYVLNNYNSFINSVKVTPGNSDYIVSGSKDKTVKIWDMRNMQLEATIKTNCSVNSIDCDPKNKYIVVGEDYDKTGKVNIEIYHVRTKKLLKLMRSSFDDSVSSVKFSPSGIHIAIGNNRNNDLVRRPLEVIKVSDLVEASAMLEFDE